MNESFESQVHTHEALYALREPAIRAAIQAMDLPAGSHGLDAGCGLGLITQRLAEAVAPGGHVTGLDLSPQFVAYAREQAGDPHVTAQITFQEGDVTDLPFNDRTFDWLWSMDTLWPGPSEFGCPSDDPFAMVREVARVVKPGGTVAILFWSSQRLLPGYPLLEARLNTTSQGAAPFQPGMRPDHHALHALTWFRAAGLVDLKARTFAADAHAPLDETTHEALTFCFAMFWAGVEPEISPEDWSAYQSLCSPDSPDFLLKDPDYYACLTYTMFSGCVAG